MAILEKSQIWSDESVCLTDDEKYCFYINSLHRSSSNFHKMNKGEKYNSAQEKQNH